ncbi:MAG: FtsQ-type POTRA domain-containing protein [Parcubacteria group bacterium]|nr:FtsQ-type POTRA domain-containing protein [Parcubacteria group bacterium]
MKIKYFLFIILFFLLAGSAAYFIFLTNFFEIKNFSIEGNKFVEKNKIEAEIWRYLEQKNFVIKNSNFIFLNTKKLSDSLLVDLPRLEDIEIDKIFFNSFIVQIKEREPIGVWCQPEICFLIDKNGVIFEKAPKIEGSLVLKISKNTDEEYKIKDQVVSASLIKSILEFKFLFERKTGKLIPEIKIGSSGDITIKTAPGFEIIFKNNFDAKELTGRLFIFLDQEIKEKTASLLYIDIRESSKIYYKFK